MGEAHREGPFERHQEEGKEPPVDPDTGTLGRIIGTKGDNEHGTYHFHVPVAQKVTDTRANTVLPYLMEASTLLMFQPLGGGHAAVNGDFAMTANQVIQASLSVNLVALRPDAFGPGRSSVRGE